MSHGSTTSETAQDFIASQLQLEADAREALPYQFDTCTKPLGALRQALYSCLTCNPPPESASEPYNPAGVCYSCSISCHGEHELVELFSRRNFVCDCGTTRFPAEAPCSLRVDEATGSKGRVHGEEAAAQNRYNPNFRNRFCDCEELYDPHTQRGTMFQCLGLGAVEDGGCGEDWWHPECVLDIAREAGQPAAQAAKKESTSGGDGTDTGSKNNPDDKPVEAVESATQDRGDAPPEETQDDDLPLPSGFPAEDDFDHFICYKCVDAFPWIKRYAGTAGFLPGVSHDAAAGGPPSDVKAEPAGIAEEGSTGPVLAADAEQGKGSPIPAAVDRIASRKRKAEDPLEASVDFHPQDTKKAKPDPSSADSPQQCSYTTLAAPASGRISLFLRHDFRDTLCRCPSCFPRLAAHPQLLEEEETYEQPASSDASSAGDGGSVGSRSLLDRGEAALSNMDRVRAIEGVMAYNHLRDKVKAFLKPFAESGTAVGAEDVKTYFEKLRGDEEAIRLAARGDGGAGGDASGDAPDGRHGQSGY